jgi:hypothetical protein
LEVNSGFISGARLYIVVLEHNLGVSASQGGLIESRSTPVYRGGAQADVVTPKAVPQEIDVEFSIAVRVLALAALAV